MKLVNGVLVLALVAGLCGCDTGGISEADTQNMRKEFSEENYEANMKRAGKEKELEAEKQRQKQYEQGGQ